MFEENTGVEEMEFAEPSEEQAEDLGEEEQETAEPVSEDESADSGKTPSDSAFAEMRRAREQAERDAREAREQLEALQAEQQARQRALDRLSGGRENAELEALADSLGIDVEDVIATLQAEEAQARIQQENEILKKQLANVENERKLDNALVEMNALDPNLSDEDRIKILEYADKGLSIEDGYYAVKAREINTRATPPKEIGKIGERTPVEKDFYTEAEVDAMTPEQQEANYEVILRSMGRW
jgi:hypothetical protein